MLFQVVIILLHLSAIIFGNPEDDQPQRKRQRINQCLVQDKIGIAALQTQCSNESVTEMKKLSELSNVIGNLKLHGAKNVADFILARLGIFDTDNLDLTELHICEDHYNELVTRQHRNRPKIKVAGSKSKKCGISQQCFPPRHKKKGAKADEDRYLRRSDSALIWNLYQVFVPIGTPLCSDHGKFVKRLAKKAEIGNSRRDNEDDNDDEPDLFITIPDDPNDVDFEPEDDGDGSLENGGEEERKAATRWHLSQISELNKITNLHSSSAFQNLGYNSQIRYAGAVKRLFDVIYNTLAPGATDSLRAYVERKLIKTSYFRKHSKEFVELAESVAEAYKDAKSRTERYQALSIIAPLVSLEELQSYIPGLSERPFKQARILAKMRRDGMQETPAQKMRVKYDEKKIQSFIEFITSSHIVYDIPWGHTTLKTSKGMKVEVAGLVRSMVNERIVQQYNSFLTEIGQENLKLSRSTMLRLLKICEAKIRKIMAGIDYFSYNGVESIDELIKLVQKIKSIDGDEDFEEESIKGLQEAKFHLKSSYKLYIHKQSPIPDQCISYALSDPADVMFQAELHTHEHKDRCYECEAMTMTLNNIKDKINTVNWPAALEKTEAQYLWEKSVDSIFEWKKHILRTINQQYAKDDIMGRLQTNEVFLTVDWSMRFLPIAGRESMIEWFGKKGIGIHVTVAFIKKANGQFSQRTYAHVFDQIEQGSRDVVAILLDTLKRIKKERPEISVAYIRSDNAGCYHGAETISSVSAISSKQAIKIKRWDFSDPQAGKDACDRSSGIIKRHVRLFAAENNKCTNAAEFVKCASSHNGIIGTTFIHAAMPDTSRTAGRRIIIPSIRQYNNFAFDRSYMTAWRAYEIGSGKRIEYQQSPDITEIEVISVYTEGKLIYERQPGQSNAVSNNLNLPSILYWRDVMSASSQSQQCSARRDYTVHPEDEDCPSAGNTASTDEAFDDEEAAVSNKLLFSCPEEGCVQAYQYEKNLARHLRIGKHIYRSERQTMRDLAISKYQKQIEHLQLFSNIPTIAAAISTSANTERAAAPNSILPMGWALRKATARKRFTKAQTDYLIAKFHEGILTGRKHTPQAVAIQMRKEPQFTNSDDWLTWQQITSYWTRLARTREQNVPAASIQEQDDVEETLADDPLMNAIDVHVNAVIQEVRAERANAAAAASSSSSTTSTAEDDYPFID